MIQSEPPIQPTEGHPVGTNMTMDGIPVGQRRIQKGQLLRNIRTKFFEGLFQLLCVFYTL